MAVLQPDNQNLVFGIIGGLILVLFVVLLIAITKMIKASRRPKKRDEVPDELPGLDKIRKQIEEDRKMEKKEITQGYPTDYDPTKDPRVVELVEGIRKDIKEIKKEKVGPESQLSFADKLKDLINYELSAQTSDSFNEAQIFMELEAAKFRLIKR
jgi:hypothetical protein